MYYTGLAFKIPAMENYSYIYTKILHNEEEASHNISAKFLLI